MGERELRCVICDRDMLFEVPPCADGHDEDCPELVCTRCGAAELLVPLIAAPRPAAGRARAARPDAPQRRAAAAPRRQPVARAKAARVPAEEARAVA